MEESLPISRQRSKGFVELFKRKSPNILKHTKAKTQIQNLVHVSNVFHQFMFAIRDWGSFQFLILISKFITPQNQVSLFSSPTPKRK